MVSALGAQRSARLWLMLLAIDSLEVASGFRGGPALPTPAASPGCRSRPISARTLLCATEAVYAPKTLRLATGVDMQYQTAGALDALDKSPVVFIHGSFHGGWCWAESWMSLFSQRGFPCFAVSLRGTSATPQVGGATSVQLQEHVDDIASFVELAVPSSRPPILIGHSFGGMVADYLKSAAFKFTIDIALTHTETHIPIRTVCPKTL